ncbi:MAG: ABC transporter substrate-binding protein [Desulfosoma sp.]|uniref:ABC transporter substrate-binding protein n=1 Tax=Desulfosoma sp. TaxID=2603217 RepID=UPI00404A3C21
MRRPTLWGAVLYLAFCLVGCGREPFRVGFSATLTGTYADLGIHGRNGARMAIESINAAGGVHGRRLELLVADDTGQSEGAREADRRLAAQGVVAIIGHMTSAMTMAALAVTKETGVPLISPTTSSPHLQGQKDLFFRVQPTSDTAARALGRWVTGKPGIQTVCTVRDLLNEPFSSPWEAAFVDEYEKLNGPVICRLTYSSTDEAFLSSLVGTLRQSVPDMVLLVSSARDTAFISRTLHEAGIPSLILTSGWAQTDALLVELGLHSTGLLLATRDAPTDTTAMLREFSWQYHKRFGVYPSFAAVRAYDAVRLLATALEEAKGQPKHLVEALSRPRTLDSLYGPLHIDAFGDASGAVYLVAVKNGRFVVLEWIAGDMP